MSGEERLKHDDPKKKEHQTHVTLTVLITGTVCGVETFPLGIKIQGLIEKILAKYPQPGQPPENWEIKDSNGTVLSPSAHLRDYTLPDDKIWLNVRTGQGG